ncbi:MAG: hypothetical protein M1817_005998 [Caeruleum heppii]|nr:MAG: hypothetical protein M1817_005998 [Caeruleum heppii]
MALPQTAIQRLPDELVSLIPSCGQPCLASFISSSWPSCSSTDSIDCLCRSTSTSGYTLGERAVQCVASGCPPTLERRTMRSIYGICEGRPDARPNTHSTLTATSSSIPTPSDDQPFINGHFAKSTSEDASPTALPSSIRHPGPSVIQDILSTATQTSSLLTSPSSTTSSSSSSPTSLQSQGAESMPATSTPRPATINGGVIAGIAVAGVASACLTIGLLLCCRYFRRRRQSKRTSDTPSFKIKPAQVDPPSRPPLVSRISQAFRQPSATLPVTAPPRSIPSTDRFSVYRRNATLSGIGITFAPEQEPHPTPIFSRTPPSHRIPAAAYRSTSALLPDKPTFHPTRPAPARIQPFQFQDPTHQPWSSSPPPPSVAGDSRRTSFACSTSTISSSCRTSIEWENEHMLLKNGPYDPKRLQWAKEMTVSPVDAPQPGALGLGPDTRWPLPPSHGPVANRDIVPAALRPAPRPVQAPSMAPQRPQLRPTETMWYVGMADLEDVQEGRKLCSNESFYVMPHRQP